MNQPMPEAHYEELAALSESYFWHWTRRELLLRQARRVQPIGSYLDVGCGLGTGTSLAARELVRCGLAGPGLVTVGIDHPALQPRLERFLAIDLEAPGEWALPALPGTRLISCMDVLEHLAEPQAVLSRIAALMGPADLALFTVPAFQRLWSAWDQKLGHRRRYTRGLLHEQLRSAGFEILDSSYLFSWAYLPGLLRARGKASELEFPRVPAPLNAALKLMGRAELALGAPFGTSVWAAARLKR